MSPPKHTTRPARVKGLHGTDLSGGGPGAVHHLRCLVVVVRAASDVLDGDRASLLGGFGPVHQHLDTLPPLPSVNPAGAGTSGALDGSCWEPV